MFLLGLMFFFAITPADVVLFVNNQYQALQSKREERASAETAYDTRLFNQKPEEESVENLTSALPDANRPHHPVYDVIADTSRFPKQQPAPVQSAQQQINPVMPNPIFTQSFSTGMDTPVAAQPAAPAEEEDDGDYFDDLLSILNKRS